MSKLEDKLAASLKPIKGRAIASKAKATTPKANTKAAGQPRAQAPASPAAAESPAAPAGKGKARAAFPNDPPQALHPDRVWPD